MHSDGWVGGWVGEGPEETWTWQLASPAGPLDDHICQIRLPAPSPIHIRSQSIYTGEHRLELVWPIFKQVVSQSRTNDSFFLQIDCLVL